MAGGASAGVFRAEQIARLPRHLKHYIVDQDYARYTPVDHAVWRYIMRQAVAFHRLHAHPGYVDGLRQTGIGLERIPRIEEMNEQLGHLGWGAATVDGFIPPAAFMEFQAHRVLVIAADIRQVDHLEYTPAPDIVHEAAGHAPIIADPEYAEYLRRFGDYGAKALSSRQDHELYEAIRHLSIVKETPGTPADEIAAAERAVADGQAGLGEPSEMALLSRLHWWTVEYGLVGTLEAPKIYGAGLLSSIGEAAHCLSDKVRKLPYGIDAASYPFDITTMQPQLFVTPDFATLNAVLEEFAGRMAFRRGGVEGLERALRSGGVATTVYRSGLQVSGVVGEVMTDERGDLAYVRTNGPTALAVGNVELPGHGQDRHAHGFGSPVGLVRGAAVPLETAGDQALRSLGIEPGRRAALEFTSGILVDGLLDRIVREDGQVVILTFHDCRVTWGDRVLFDPAWGTYDCAIGSQVVSVFQGAADKDSYEQVSLVPREPTVRSAAPEARRLLLELYQSVREVRESGRGADQVPALYETLRKTYPDDWLLALEMLEILTARDTQPQLAAAIRQALAEMAAREPSRAKLVGDGLRLIGPD